MRPVAVLETRCTTHVNKFLKFAVFKFFSRNVVNKLSDIEKYIFENGKHTPQNIQSAMLIYNFFFFCGKLKFRATNGINMNALTELTELNVLPC